MPCAECGSWVDRPVWRCVGQHNPENDHGYVSWGVDDRGNLWVTRCHRCRIDGLLIEFTDRLEEAIDRLTEAVSHAVGKNATPRR